MEVRRLRANEVEVYKSLRLQSLKDSPRFFGTRYEDALLRSDQEWRAQALSAVSGSDRNTVIAFHNNQPVGLVSLYREEGTSSGEVMQLWVDPTHRGKGVGMRMLRELLAWASRHGFRLLFAEIEKDNRSSLSLFERCAFQIDQTFSSTQKPPKRLRVKKSL